MTPLLSHILGRTPKPFTAPLSPQAPFSVIGDVHGRVDLLSKLLIKLDPDHPLIFVGDLIDRGPHSSDVLELIHALRQTRDVIVLKGNHEAMCLEFLDHPTSSAGQSWLHHGGRATLESFGINKIANDLAEDDYVGLSAAFEKLVGSEQISWLRDLPMLWQNGNVAVVHAAADPTRAITEQSDHTLMWGHPKFTEIPRSDGVWIVHGHTIRPHPSAEQGRIAIDTGAYLSNRLTAVTIDDARHFFTQSKHEEKQKHCVLKLRTIVINC